jgi:hypothetical protein
VSDNEASLHFWRASRDDVRQFVISCGATGRIFADNANWTCLVPFDRDDEATLLTSWQGIVLNWSYSQDYGLGLNFHQGGRILGGASFIWGTGLRAHLPGGSFSRDLCSHLVASKVLSTEDTEQLEKVLADITAGSISGSVVRDRVAKILGLAAFELLSPETCLLESLESTREDYPDAEDIEQLQQSHPG